MSEDVVKLIRGWAEECREHATAGERTAGQVRLGWSVEKAVAKWWALAWAYDHVAARLEKPFNFRIVRDDGDG